MANYCGVVEESKVIDIRKIKAWGYLSKVAYGDLNWRIRGEIVSTISVNSECNINEIDRLRLHYNIVDTKENINYLVEIIKTPCYFGGYRYWFKCPLYQNGIPCNKRVTKLYKCGGGKYFGCRKCLKLIYEEQIESKKFRGFYLHKYEDKIQTLEPIIKKKHYRGKVTKKYKQLLNLRIKEYRSLLFISNLEKSM